MDLGLLIIIDEFVQGVAFGRENRFVRLRKLLERRVVSGVHEHQGIGIRRL